MADENEDPIIDINQSILGKLEAVPNDEKSEAHEDSTSDDEFEKLLNSFIASEKSDTMDIQGEEIPEQKPAEVKASKEGFGTDESELAQAYQNLIDSVEALAGAHGAQMPDLIFNPASLVPNYKPSLGRKIVKDTLACWDVMFEVYPDKLTDLKPNSTDEQFLNFAENLSDQNLQLAIISYVEILIDIENCEISYEERRLKAQRKRIERALYEEYQRRRDRKLRFIEAVEAKNFPISAERLINNYFKTATKDPKAAFEVLTTNPAVYAPIENEKIKPRFFGLMKVTPEDGIRENHRIGVFLKNLRV